MEGIMMKAEDTTRAQVEDASAKLHEKVSESSALKLENDRLRVRLQGLCHFPPCVHECQLSAVKFLCLKLSVP